MSLSISGKLFSQEDSESFEGTWKVKEWRDHKGKKIKKFDNFFIHAFRNGLILFETDNLDSLAPKNNHLAFWASASKKDKRKNIITITDERKEVSQFKFSKTQTLFSLRNLNQDDGQYILDKIGSEITNLIPASYADLKGLWSIKMYLTYSGNSPFFLQLQNNRFLDIHQKDSMNGDLIYINSDIERNDSIKLNNINILPYQLNDIKIYNEKVEAKISSIASNQTGRFLCQHYKNIVIARLISGDYIILRKLMDTNFFSLKEVKEKYNNYLAWIESNKKYYTITIPGNEPAVRESRPTFGEILLGAVLLGLGNSKGNSSSNSTRDKHWKTCGKCSGSGKNDKVAASGIFVDCSECKGKGGYMVYDDTGEKN